MDEEIIELMARAIDPIAFSNFEAGGENSDYDRAKCEVARRKARNAIAALNAAGYKL